MTYTKKEQERVFKDRVNKQETTKKEFYGMCQEKNQTVVKYQLGAPRNTKSHLVSCNYGKNLYETSFLDLRRKVGQGCKKCACQTIRRTSIVNRDAQLPNQDPQLATLSGLSRRRYRQRTNNSLTIKNPTQMIQFLKGQSLDRRTGRYYKYILGLYTSPDSSNVKRRPGFEGHHIIPLFDSGPDENWNIISLTPVQHYTAHILRALDFKNQYDMKALGIIKASLDSLIQQPTEEMEKAVSKVVEERGSLRKENKKENAKKVYSARDILFNRSIWQHPDLKQELVIEPFQVHRMGDLKTIFAASLPETVLKKRLLNSARKNFSVRMVQLISGRQPSVFGWTLKEIEVVSKEKMLIFFVGKTTGWHYQQKTNTYFTFKINSMEDIYNLKKAFYVKFKNYTRTRKLLESSRPDEFLEKILLILKGYKTGCFGIIFKGFIT